MAETPLDEPRFTDAEVREILRRAVQQASGQGALVKRDGVSLAELKAIGHEVGIDAGRLEDAARSVALERSNRAHPMLGAPRVVNLERRAAGTVPPEEAPRVLALIRRSMGEKGEVAQLHGSLEWSASGELADRHIALVSRDGGTTIHGSANLTKAALVTYLPGGIFGLITALIGLTEFVREDSIIGLIVCLVVLTGLYPALRALLGRISRSEAGKLERVVDELARFAADAGDADGATADGTA